LRHINEYITCFVAETAADKQVDIVHLQYGEIVKLRTLTYKDQPVFHETLHQLDYPLETMHANTRAEGYGDS
jgi:hypothetical protein